MRKLSNFWTVDRWWERGGPVIYPPTRKGMGMRLIAEGLPHALDGICHMDFEPDGFRMEVVAPLSSTVQLG